MKKTAGLFLGIVPFLVSAAMAVMGLLRIDNSFASLVFKVAAVLSSVVFLLFLKKMDALPMSFCYILLAIVGLLVLSAITVFKYGFVHPVLKSGILSLVACSVPATIAGMALACQKIKINKWVFLIIDFLLLVGQVNAILTKTHLLLVYGYNYQTVSYSAVIGIGISLSLILDIDFSGTEQRIVFKVVSIVLALAHGFCLIKAQGRGAMVACALIIVSFFVSLLKNSKKCSFLVILTVVLLLGIAGFGTDIISSLLRSRLGQTLSSLVSNPKQYLLNDARFVMFMDALRAFIKRPMIGNGVGSVIYETDFYSHCIVSDLLCEYGIIGCAIIGVVFGKVCKGIFNGEQKSFFPVFVFLVGFTRSLFSNYYMENTELWFSVGFGITFWIMHDACRSSSPLSFSTMKICGDAK